MRKLSNIAIAAVMATLLLTGLTLAQNKASVLRPLPVKGTDSGTTVLAGALIDANGVPQPGVLVTCQSQFGSQASVTDFDGTYRFSISRSGVYTITPQPKNYSPGSAVFDVSVPGADFVKQ